MNQQKSLACAKARLSILFAPVVLVIRLDLGLGNHIRDVGHERIAGGRGRGHGRRHRFGCFERIVAGLVESRAVDKLAPRLKRLLQMLHHA